MRLLCSLNGAIAITSVCVRFTVGSHHWWQMNFKVCDCCASVTVTVRTDRCCESGTVFPSIEIVALQMPYCTQLGDVLNLLSGCMSQDHQK
jgi:hypothetical protein